jgi:hypothetical protein
MHNEMLSVVAIRVCNPDCSPLSSDERAEGLHIRPHNRARLLGTFAHLPVYSSVAKNFCGNSLRHFPYNKVTDESPPAGAAKHRVPDYNDKNSTETKAAESKQTRTL